MNYEVVGAETMDIMELDYGDTFCFREGIFMVRMLIVNPFENFAGPIPKEMQEFSNRYDGMHWFVTLDDGSVSCCKNCKVIPVKPHGGLISFMPKLKS